MPKPQLILRDAPGERHLLLGNEAIARGIIEAGVGVLSTYPGTPSSEIADTISAVAKEAGLYMEYSTNEIVALEVAAGAAMSGVRSVVCMKHVGLNVAADAFMTLAYTGVRAGMVVISADDPNAYSSQNEQDNRFYALLAGIPMLEPSNPQEAKDMLIHCLELSERLELPCLLRTTTRVNHTRGPVEFGPIKRPRLDGRFVRDSRRFVMIPANARVRHRVLLEKLGASRELSEHSPYNIVARDGYEVGIITSGVSYNYVVEAVEALDVDAGILKLGMTHPLPERMIGDFLGRFERVLVVEELEPYLEVQVRSIAKECAPDVAVYGKVGAEFLPRFGELSTRLVVEALSKLLNKPPPERFEGLDERLPDSVKRLPPRPPVLCPGCPHRASFYEIREATGGEFVCTTDIGCYALGVQPPLRVGDVLICMGASLGLACGISRATNSRVVAVVGDSTFFHAAIPGLINAAYNGHKVTVAVLDNETTAMTGDQPHPGTGVTGMGERGRKILIEDVARACGADYVRVVNPFNVKKAIETFREALKVDGVSVVIFRQPCRLLVVRNLRRKGREPPKCVVTDECTNCRVCIDRFACPAFYIEDGAIRINPILCTGCMVCIQICPYGAIKVERR